MGGLFIVSVDIFIGRALGVNSLGVLFVTSGIALVLMSTLIYKENEEHDEDFPPLVTLASPTYSSPKGSTLSSRSIERHVCPSCGYENRPGVFFCDACNSPIWPAGTPVGRPPDRVVVEKRRNVIRARARVRRKAIRIILVVIVSILATFPIWSSVITGYAEVNASQLGIVIEFPPYSQPWTTDIVATVWSEGGIPSVGQIMNPTFTLVVPGGGATRITCPSGTVNRNPAYTCKILTIPYSQYGSYASLSLSMEAVLRFGLYQATITRTTSSEVYAYNHLA